MTDGTTLESQLGRLRAAAAERTPEEVRTLAAQFLTELEKTTVRGALAVGAKAPDFVLNAAGDDRKVWLADELRQGPVVLSFYRGQWCPYCNLAGAAAALPTDAGRSRAGIPGWPRDARQRPKADRKDGQFNPDSVRS